MPSEKIKERIISLYAERKGIDEEIQSLQNQLVEQLCPKEKKECEPEYCTFRLTDTCPFLEEWHKILTEAHVPEETVSDVLLDVVEKALKDKDVSERNG